MGNYAVNYGNCQFFAWLHEITGKYSIFGVILRTTGNFLLQNEICELDFAFSAIYARLIYRNYALNYNNYVVNYGNYRFFYRRMERRRTPFMYKYSPADYLDLHVVTALPTIVGVYWKKWEKQFGKHFL